MHRRFKHIVATHVVAAAGAFAALSGCQQYRELIFIEGVIPVVGPDCSLRADGREFSSGTIFDIGTDEATANDLTLAVQVRLKRAPETNGAVVTFTHAEVFFARVAEGDGPADKFKKDVPDSETHAWQAVLGGAVSDEPRGAQVTALAFQAITPELAIALQKEPFVIDALGGDPTKSVRLIATIRVVGRTLAGADVRTPPLSFPVELCVGCLTTFIADCSPTAVGNQPAVPNDRVCFFGQDGPAFVCASDEDAP